LAVLAPRAETQTKPSTAQAKVVGTIKSLNGNNLVVTSDEGKEVQVTVEDSTRVLQVNPGQTDLKQAATVSLQDLQTGDRVLVRGNPGSDSKAMTASAVIVMKKIDLEARHQRERQEWQRRGVGGLVSAVDPETGDITLSVMAMGVKKVVVVHTVKSTIIRRYAPNSVKFDDAKPSTLAEIKPGDQLRARGTRSDDGAQFTADEIVSGSFRNIAGTVSAIDASSDTITVADSISKKTVEVKVTSESQLRKLPAPIAQRIAIRLKAGPQEGTAAPGAPATGASAPAAGGAGARMGAPGGGNFQGARGGSPEGGTGSAGGDFQQVLTRLPASSLGDFQKGDAVMIVSTDAGEGDQVTAITVVGGVEPILTAAPKGARDMVLSPWSLSAPEGGG
jgi:hypothetical protein